MDDRRKVLKYFASRFNSAGITYGLGGSYLLKLSGIKCNVKDIDFVVHEDDLEKLKEVISIYPYVSTTANEKYATKEFYTLTLNNIDIDIMVGFKVNTENGVHEFRLINTKDIMIDNIKVTLSSLHEWLEAYRAMGREDKVLLLEKHLKKTSR